VFWLNSPKRARAVSFLRFLDHTQWHTTVGGTPLKGESTRRRDLYLTTQHSQEIDIHTPGRIRTRNPSKWVGADPRLRPLGHWDWLIRLSDLFRNSSWLYHFSQHILSGRQNRFSVFVTFNFLTISSTNIKVVGPWGFWRTSEVFGSRTVIFKLQMLKFCIFEHVATAQITYEIPFLLINGQLTSSLWNITAITDHGSDVRARWIPCSARFSGRRGRGFCPSGTRRRATLFVAIYCRLSQASRGPRKMPRNYHLELLGQTY
jgi:hypothetical protein